MRLPFEVADYVDFYSSLEHATNIGRMFRPGQEPLHAELALAAGRLPRPRRHGRRQRHRRRPPARAAQARGRRPGVRPDGRGSTSSSSSASWSACPGETIAVDAFAEHVFGVVLVNDWSARDIQAWEYVPLGPFLGKSFQTSISAWVTPLALLEPRRVEAPPQEPPPLATSGRRPRLGLSTSSSSSSSNGEVVSRGNARTLYWTMPQQLAHATSNGASVRTGDLMATGAISGPEPGSEGSLLELWAGERFLADGDEVVLRARGGDVELGEVRGRVVSEAPEGGG